jgi:hypothetical protein
MHHQASLHNWSQAARWVEFLALPNAADNYVKLGMFAIDENNTFKTAPS